MKRYIFPFVFMLLCLPACVRQAGVEAGSLSPFAATGLLAHPAETAEEILIRAHSQDLDAIMLVNAGYAFGIGGFPKDRSLSLFFVSNELAACNEDFIEAMKKSGGSAFYLKPNKYGCSFARQSPYMPIFKEAGLFDLDDICSEVGYNELKADFCDEFLSEEWKTLLLELAERPMAGEDAENLSWFLIEPYNNLEYVGHVLAGSAAGSNGDYSPAQAKAALLPFIRQRMNETLPASLALREGVIDVLMQMNAADINNDLAKDIIRKAHQGDAAAARMMAESYRTGSLGFPEDHAMHMAWLYRAAIAGDKNALEGYVLAHYAGGLMKYAWVHAQIGLLYGDPAHRPLYEAIIAETAKQYSDEEVRTFWSDVDAVLAEMKADGFRAE